MKMSDYADSTQLNLYKNFPSTHYLSNPKNVFNTLAWITFFRRNMHRCAIDYLGIKLYPYQELIIYQLGINDLTNIVGSRAIAKSFLIGLYACIHCILYPKSEVVIASSTVAQAELIISRKIEVELMGASPQLRKEIKEIKRVQGKLQVKFHNLSTITVVAALDSARGSRSTVLIREENRMIKKEVDDSILSPFQHTRDVPYIHLEEYENVAELKEEPTNVYITSSWLDDGHWMWNIADNAYKDMLNNKPQALLAFDESVVLKHGIKTKKQLTLEKRKVDSLSWRIEYLNERPKENTHAYFSYDLLSQNQRLKKAFYPRKHADVRLRKKNPHEIPKQQGEIRVVACDMAFITNKKNDNSIFTCMRLLPESVTYHTEEKNIEIHNGYRRQVPYLESIQGGDIAKQALRIRQLYEDFDSDYIVLDLRNAGIAVYDSLAKVMYDEERDVEYCPLSCMNNDEIANRIKSAGAKPVIFVITASQKQNSDFAIGFRNALENKMIDFLVSYNVGADEILSNMPEYKEAMESSLEEQLFYEKPYYETQELISETINLTYEKKEQTGTIVISEQGANRKDRYTSVSYGSAFADLLEQDLLSDTSEYSYGVFVN